MKKFVLGVLAGLTAVVLGLVVPFSAAQASTLSWSAPVTVTDQGARHISFTTSPAGLVTAIWEIAGGGVFSSTSRHGAAWSAPEQIVDSGWATGVLSNSTGLVVALWTNPEGAAVWSVASDNGGPWTTAVQIKPPGGNGNVQFSVGADGTFVASWFEGTNNSRVIVTRTSRDGTTWSSPLSLDLGVDGANNIFSVGADDVGSLVLCYLKEDGAHNVIEAVKSLPDATWSSPTRLSAPGEAPMGISLAMGSDGRGVCTWVNISGQTTQIKASVVRRGVWLAAVSLSSTGVNFGPTPVFDAKGRALVAWGHGSGIQSRSSQDGALWSPVKSVPRENSGPSEISIAVDANGTMVMTYFNGNDYSGWTTVAADGGSWGAPVMLDPRNVGGVVVDADGLFTTVYGSVDENYSPLGLLARTLNDPPRPASLPNTGVDQPRLLGLSIFGLLAFIGGAVLVTASRRRDGKSTPQAKG